MKMITGELQKADSKRLKDNYKEIECQKKVFQRRGKELYCLSLYILYNFFSRGYFRKFCSILFGALQELSIFLTYS